MTNDNSTPMAVQPAPITAGTVLQCGSHALGGGRCYLCHSHDGEHLFSCPSPSRLPFAVASMLWEQVENDTPVAEQAAGLLGLPKGTDPEGIRLTLTALKALEAFWEAKNALEKHADVQEEAFATLDETLSTVQRVDDLSTRDVMLAYSLMVEKSKARAIATEELL